MRRTPLLADFQDLHVKSGMALVGDAEGLTGVDLETWHPMWRLRQTSRRGLAIAPRASVFFQAEDRQVVRHSLRTGGAVGDPIDLEPSDDRPVHVACSTDGSVLVVGTERGVLLRFQVNGR